MAKIIDRKFVSENLDEIISAIKSGKIFIYPTDTIYGLGCNASIDTAVQKIREIKKRPEKALSVIAPNKSWIIENCKLKIENLNKYLPGPFTLFVRKGDKCQVSPLVNTSDNTLGVRIPNNWFTDIISKSEVPFVTTSVNISGEKNMEKIEDVSEEILEQVDYVVYDGEIKGEPSTKIDLTN